MSAALDNLTTTIVMVALLRKLITDKPTRCFFARIIVIAASAGGAWSPAGNVTTIMLWIGGQVTTGAIITRFIIPGLVSITAPLIILAFIVKGTVTRPEMLEMSANPEYLKFFVQDGLFWEFLAYCAGTGGCMLIIDSPAGVAAMGLERTDLIWCMKKISWLAITGYLAGGGAYREQAQIWVVH